MKIKNLIVIFLTLIFLSGCSVSEANEYNFKSDEYVELYDYKNIEVEKNYIEISKEDIDAIINLDFSSKEFYIRDTTTNIIKEEDIILLDIECSNEYYQTKNCYYEVGSCMLSTEFDNLLIGKSSYENFQYIHEINNEKIIMNIILKGIFILNDINNKNTVCQFYGMDSMNDVVEYLTKRAQEEILYNYAIELILNNSKLKSFPKSIVIKAESILEATYSDIENNPSIEELQQSVYNYFYEIMILKAILEKENITVGTVDIERKIMHIAEDNDLSADEVKKYYSYDDLYYLTIVDILKPILANYIIIKDQ